MFICLCSRAIRIEVAHSLDTDKPSTEIMKVYRENRQNSEDEV